MKELKGSKKGKKSKKGEKDFLPFLLPFKSLTKAFARPFAQVEILPDCSSSTAEIRNYPKFGINTFELNRGGGYGV